MLRLDNAKIVREHAKIIEKELTDMVLHPRIRVSSEEGWERIEIKVFYRRFLADVDMDWIFSVLHRLGYHKEIWFTFLPGRGGVWLYIVINLKPL
jgi:hypothetical protein